VTLERISGAMYWSVIAKAIRFIAGIVANILIVRSLGKLNWGMYSVVKTILAFAFAIVMLGAGNALLKFLPEIRVRGGIVGFVRTMKRLFVLQVVVWLSLLAAVYFVGPHLSKIFAGRFDQLGYYLLFGFGFVIFEVFLGLVTSFVQSWYETRWYAVVTLFGNVAYIGCLVYFLESGAGIVGVLLSGAIVNIAMSLLLLPQATKLVGLERESTGEGTSLGSVLRFSLPFVATGMLNIVVWRQSEVLFLGAFHGEEAAGFFGLAYSLPQLLLEFVPLTIWPLVMAGISEAYARDAQRLPAAIGLYYRLLYILVIPVAALGFAFARPLVPIVYGAEMLPAAVFVQLFFVVFSYSFLYTPLSMALYVMGRSWVNMLIFTFLAIVNVGLDLALIPRYGLWGAFIPVALVMIIGVAVFYAAVKKYSRSVRIPVPFIVRCYIAALPAAALAISAARWDSLVLLLPQIGIGIALLIVGFRFMRVIGSEERELIERLPIPMKGTILKLL
jgi:O-antigen/teichoic acid export membrane protein